MPYYDFQLRAKPKLPGGIAVFWEHELADPIYRKHDGSVWAMNLEDAYKRIARFTGLNAVHERGR
jgi:hypothetical protein